MYIRTSSNVSPQQWPPALSNNYRHSMRIYKYSTGVRKPAVGIYYNYDLKLLTLVKINSHITRHQYMFITHYIYSLTWH